MRITMNYEGRRRHLAVVRCGSKSPMPWALQWANPTQHGHSYERPIGLYQTQREAVEAKREIMRGAP